MTITTVKKGFQAKQFNSLIFQTADTGTEEKTNKMAEETELENTYLCVFTASSNRQIALIP